MDEPPNLLIEKCLEEMIRKSKNSKVQNGFKKALEELKKYPLPLKSGRECSIIIGFGEKICSIVDDWLDKTKKNEEKNKNTEKSPEKPGKNCVVDSRNLERQIMQQNICNVEFTENKKVTKEYEEIEILSSDSDEESNRFCKKDIEPANDPEIVEFPEMFKKSVAVSPVNFSDTLEEFPDCTAVMNFNCKKTPVKRPLEKPTKSSREYPGGLKKVKSSLESPEKYPEKLEELADQSEIVKTSSVLSSEECSQETEQFFLLPNNIDIILLVDKQETCGGKTRPQDDETISELNKAKILFEVRSLKVGDFAWIARCKLTNKELVLPYIVERKTLEDLSSSIKDGRYHEQKFRLSQCGIKNVIYLIENYRSTYRGSIPLTSLLQAGSNCLIQDKFLVQYTKNHKESMRYLAATTAQLTNIYEGKELISCQKKNLDVRNFRTNSSTEYLMVFDHFNKAAAKYKNYTVQNLLTRHLIKLSGLSAEKAAAIAKRYPTPRILAQAFEDGDENILADISIGPSKKIGPAISKTIYQLYSKLELD